MKTQLTKYNLILILSIVSASLISQSTHGENSNDIYFVVSKDNKIGIVNLRQEIIPIEYKSIQAASIGNNLLIASKEIHGSNQLKWGAINLNNEIIIPFEFNHLNSWQSKNYIIGTIKDLKGIELQKVFDYSGTEVFPSNLENAWYFTDTIAKVKDIKHEYLINSKGNRITKKYDRIYNMVNGMIKFKEGELAGYLDSNYVEVIPAKYDWFATGSFKDNGLANVRYEDEWTEAEIRKDGSEVFNIGMNYRYADSYRKNNFLLAYEVDPKEENSSFDHCLFDFNNGKLVYNFGPAMAGSGYQVFNNQIAFWGRPMHQDYYELTRIERNGKIINKTKIPIVENYTNDALILIDRNIEQNKYGIIPMNSSSKIEMKFDSLYHIRSFEDDSYVIIAKQNGKFGIIDKNGSTVLDFKFDKMKRINSGDIVVSRNTKTSLFSKSGDLKIENCRYHIVDSIKVNPSWYIVQSNNMVGIYDFKLESWIIHPKYSTIETIE